MKKVTWVAKAALCVLANITITVCVLRNAWSVGGSWYGQDGAEIFFFFTLFGSSVFPPPVNWYTVFVPAFMFAVLVPFLAPWGWFTGAGVIVSYFLARWLNPEFLIAEPKEQHATLE